jgi:cytochrome c
MARAESFVPRLAGIALGMVAILASSFAHAQDARDLLQRFKCYSCHADRETKTGPAFVDVSSKYGNQPTAAKELTALLRRGTRAGPWHMPPHPEISDSDARRMVQYILSLRQ